MSAHREGAVHRAEPATNQALHLARSARRRDLVVIAGSAGSVQALLDELEHDGLAERDGDRWRLTVQAEARFGSAFRDVRAA